MRRKLFTVTDCFQIGTRGAIIVGNLPVTTPTPKTGSTIVLVTPVGREISTKIGGINWPTAAGNVPKIAFLIKNISKEELPVGTEVFSGA